MRSFTTDILRFSLIMRSFKTSKVELFQLDPTPGFRLATPMTLYRKRKHNLLPLSRIRLISHNPTLQKTLAFTQQQQPRVKQLASLVFSRSVTRFMKQ